MHTENLLRNILRNSLFIVYIYVYTNYIIPNKYVINLNLINDNYILAFIVLECVWFFFSFEIAFLEEKIKTDNNNFIHT